MDRDERIALSRLHDPARGDFTPSGESYPPKTQDNPQGTGHINKTEQDQAPKAERIRVQRAEARKGKPNHLRGNDHV